MTGKPPEDAFRFRPLNFSCFFKKWPRPQNGRMPLYDRKKNKKSAEVLF